MFNPYTNSVLWPIRSRNCQDYCSLLPERSETFQFAKASTSSRCCCARSRSPSRCFSCYCSTPSSSFSVKPKVLINPGFVLYGLRQSTLIQWPSFRRRLLVSVGGDRLMGCEADGHCCESEVYSSCGGTRRNRGFRVRASKDCGRSSSGDVESMISFLSEELINEERNWNSVSRIEERKKVRYGGEFHGGNVRKVKVEGRDIYGKREGVKRPEGYWRNGIAQGVKLEEKYHCEHCGARKKNSQPENDSHRGSNLVTGDSIGKTYRKNEEKEVRPIRTKSSSCSSHYSLASSGEFESDTEDQEEDVEFHRENLRNSEKKVVEKSTRGMKSRKEVSQMHSRRKTDESANGVGSSYHKNYIQTGGRVSEARGKYDEDIEIHEIHVNDAETNSLIQNIFGERDNNRVHSIRNDFGRENFESSQQQLNERLGARYSSEERMSEMRRRSKYTSSQDAVIDQRPLGEEQRSKQAGMRISTERFSDDSKIHDIDIRNTYVSQSEDQMRNEEVNAGLVSGLQLEVDQQGYHTYQVPLQKKQSDQTSVHVSHTSDAVRYAEIKRKYENRIVGQGSNTIAETDSKAEKGPARKDSRLDHANSTKEGQKAFGLQRSQEKLSEEASSSQSSLTLVSRNRTQLVNRVSEEMQGSETTLIPPSSQLVSRGSGRSYATDGASIQEISHRNPIASEIPGAGDYISSQSDGEIMRFTTPEDSLGSAHRLEQSSEKFIGEFMERAKHKASTKETEEGRAESIQLKRRDSRQSSDASGEKGPSDEMWVTDSAQGTPQPGAIEGTASEGTAVFKRNGRSLWSVIADIARLRWGSRAGSPDSIAKPGGKGSPNESVSSATWFSGREHEGSSDDNTKGDRVLPQGVVSPHQLEVGQTSSRSQFESSDPSKLKQKSGGHEGVVVSSTFDTRLEEEEGHEGVVVSSTFGSASYHLSSTSGDQIFGVEEEEGRDFDFRLSDTASTELPMRLPSRNLKRSPAIKEPSESNPIEVSSDQTGSVGEGRHYQARVPAIDAVQKQLPFPGRNLRSPVVKEHSESRPTLVGGGSRLREQVEQQQPLSAKSQEETGSGPADSALIQRKLQRNKQVVRNSFEEWEEAYRVEAERRTADEIFMREALIEAKKAAEIWEVPVGAVLVHDGKIIARGFNLVEDLRDSTAHAEMICIREGSKVLRSWRLADTTLYVTLEPCPMCAGAILQARVNTLVWGAPNKLLGADGSWIRLFPGGEGNGSEFSEKPPPPVHPFHPKMTIRRGVLESECAQTMQQFFQLRRKKKDKNSDQPAPIDHHHHHPSKLLNKLHQILPFFCL